MKPQNLHTHTTFCDGKNTPAEMAAAAFAAGLGAIGFSGHSPLEGEEWCMAPADLPACRAAVEAEREKYAGRMQVFLGLEQVFFSPPPEGAFDYLIGSVHGLRLDGCLFSVDESPEAFARLADRCGGVRGLLRDPKDESTLIRSIQMSQVPGLVMDGIITGGMIPKVECCVESVRSGVKSAVIIDGRIPHSILIELLSDEGIGTMLY